MYSGRKSWPHCETQCASSMANRATRDAGSPSASPASRVEEPVGHEPLGRHVEQVELAGVQLRQHAARLGAVERRVVEGGAHAVGAQRVDLVFHQRDERRDDDADAGPQQRRDLVAERLAAAGGHEHEGVAAGDDVLDDLELVGAILAKAEDRVQDGGRVGGRVCERRKGRAGHGPSVAQAVDGTGRAGRTARPPRPPRARQRGRGGCRRPCPKSIARSWSDYCTFTSTSAAV